MSVLTTAFADSVLALTQVLQVVPATKTVSVNQLNIHNPSGVPTVINAEVHPLGIAANAVALAKDVTLPAETAYVFDGALLLNGTDEIHVSSTVSAVDVHGSIVESTTSDNPLWLSVYGNNFNTAGLLTTLYTVPVLRTDDIVLLQITNTAAANATIDITTIPNLSPAISLANNVTVAPDETYEYDGVLAQGPGAQLQIATTQPCDIVASIMRFA